MLTKALYPSFNKFVLALQDHEQTLSLHREEEKTYIQHSKAFFSQRGRGQGKRFSSRGRGFTPFERCNNYQRNLAPTNQPIIKVYNQDRKIGHNNVPTTSTIPVKFFVKYVGKLIILQLIITTRKKIISDEIFLL